MNDGIALNNVSHTLTAVTIARHDGIDLEFAGVRVFARFHPGMTPYEVYRRLQDLSATLAEQFE